jgi:hypothetical protein
MSRHLKTRHDCLKHLKNYKHSQKKKVTSFLKTSFQKMTLSACETKFSPSHKIITGWPPTHPTNWVWQHLKPPNTKKTHPNGAPFIATYKNAMPFTHWPYTHASFVLSKFYLTNPSCHTVATFCACSFPTLPDILRHPTKTTFILAAVKTHGTHKQGKLETQTAEGAGGRGVTLDENTHWVAAPMNCGDVLFLHSLTVHQGKDNQSERLRLSCDYRYQPRSHPVREDSLQPHLNWLTWDDIYAEWPKDDPVKYYWQNWNINITPRT